MKKAFVVAMFMMLMAGVVYAGAPYVGLFAGIWSTDDPPVEGPGGYDHSSCSVQVSDIYTDIEMWIWFLPDAVQGMAADEFMIVYPTSTYIIQGSVTANPLEQVSLGTLSTGMSQSIGQYFCQYDWFWSHHQTITLKKVTPSGYISITADPTISNPDWMGKIIVVGCDLTKWEVTKINALGLNQACNVAVQEKSWGSIKSLYNE
jgi:hypothetical protein